MGGTVKDIIKKPTGFLLGGLGGHFIAKELGKKGKAPQGIGEQDPAQLLAQTGGAPLLANIALGANIDETMAGYLGISSYEVQQALQGRISPGVSEEQLKLIQSVHGQLSSIQKNTNLRNEAVQKVVNDFPEVAKYAAQERIKSGAEFDEVTKGYMQLALDKTASQYAAGGNLSSGAANEAFARVGAEQGLNKLDYMGGREQFAYNTRLNEMNTRLSEVNALRDFQNTLLGQTSTQGFSAQQAALQRQFSGQMFNAEQANQRYMSDQASRNAMLGSVGSLVGTGAGFMFGGPMGAAAGNQIGGQLLGSPKANFNNIQGVPRYNNNQFNGMM